MKQFHIQELDVELGDIVVCVSENTEMFTKGCAYVVEQADDGRCGVMTDCGFIATTSASLFTPIGMLDEQPVRGEVCYQIRSIVPQAICVSLRRSVIDNDNFTTREGKIRAA